MWARMASLHTEPAQESLISGSWWLLKCCHSPIYYIHIARWRDSDIPQIDDRWIDQHLDSTGRYWKQNIKSLSFAEGLDGLDLHIGLFIQTFHMSRSLTISRQAAKHFYPWVPKRSAWPLRDDEAQRDMLWQSWFFNQPMSLVGLRQN